MRQFLAILRQRLAFKVLIVNNTVMRNHPRVMLLFDTSMKTGRDMLIGISKYSNLNSTWELCRIPLFYWEPPRKKKDSGFWGIEDADGIIIGDMKKRVKVTANTPFVVLSQDDLIPNVPNVITEGDKIGNIAAEHLIDLGHKNFAYCGFKGVSWSEERSESFSKRIAQSGFEIHIYQPSKYRGGASWQKKQLFMIDWLNSLPKPIGLMACNDNRGLQIIEACKFAGIRIPEDIAVIGVDNDKVTCQVCSPTLTSIDLNFERAGYEAAELLDRLMAGEEFSGQHIFVQTTRIVQRESTGTLVIKDDLVAQAVSFIRKNAAKHIGAADVIDEVPASRRVLERRFRKELGRSILAEIRRVRIERIARMLLETNLSVSQIALNLGFSDVSHITRFFRSMKGMSMLEYRRKFGGI